MKTKYYVMRFPKDYDKLLIKKENFKFKVMKWMVLDKWKDTDNSWDSIINGAITLNRLCKNFKKDFGNVDIEEITEEELFLKLL